MGQPPTLESSCRYRVWGKCGEGGRAAGGGVHGTSVACRRERHYILSCDSPNLQLAGCMALETGAKHPARAIVNSRAVEVNFSILPCVFLSDWVTRDRRK